MTIDTPTYTFSHSDRPNLLLRIWLWFVRRLRPAYGWSVLFICLALATLPALALRANNWVRLGSIQNVLEWVGPLAVLTVWWLWGWGKPRPFSRYPWRGLGAILIGILVISQLLLGWIPGPRLWVLAARGEPQPLLAFSIEIWFGFATRTVLWWRGVLSGGAAQDNLVFASMAAVVLWIFSVAAAWLARRTGQGYAAAAPIIWLLGSILLYSSEGRLLLVAALAFTVALQLLLDQGTLQTRWEALALDYSPGLFTDRALAVFSGGALILVIAALLPNLYFEPLVKRYYAQLGPVIAQIEDMGDRLFPELRGTSRLRGGTGTGLPNEFLLRGGPDLGTAIVMEVRTDEPLPMYDMPYDELAPPQGHYMRGGTLTRYDGRGWSNPATDEREMLPANTRWREVGWGRRPVVQSVVMQVTSPNLYAAAEPVEFSVDSQLELREPGDLIEVNGREASYTVVSAVPAVNEEMLRSLPTWGAASPLPEGYEQYLDLPDTVTARTRSLVESLVQEAATDYDKALAIEQYLRQFQYDLEVSDPPRRVEDVADYFLFDLQRGYCDYYATAFVVMARMANLPTRFATGFAVGRWDFAEAIWIITEAEAHSWPEVYFPEVGWVPFEPTAGRPNLTRIAPASSSGVAAPLPPPAAQTAAEQQTEATWNWQMLIWLIPLGAAGWLVYVAYAVWVRQRQDPWTTLLAWGARAGHPIGPGDTVLEYGEGLAGHVVTLGRSDADARRQAAREIRELSQDVSDLRYSVGPADVRRQAIIERWGRLRGYLRLLRVR